MFFSKEIAIRENSLISWENLQTTTWKGFLLRQEFENLSTTKNAFRITTNSVEDTAFRLTFKTYTRVPHSTDKIMNLHFFLLPYFLNLSTFFLTFTISVRCSQKYLIPTLKKRRPRNTMKITKFQSFNPSTSVFKILNALQKGSFSTIKSFWERGERETEWTERRESGRLGNVSAY